MAKQILVSLDVSGDISDDSGNTIYDYSNSYIPDAIIQQSSLDADTLDSVQLANITWSDVSMATSDVGSSDVGLGNVTNDAQVAKDGSIPWTGGQDAGGNSISNIPYFSDNDGDTRVTVEETTDSDVVRIYANGTEIVNIDDT